MKASNPLSTTLGATVIAMFSLAVLLFGVETRTEAVVVQAESLEAAARAVERVGGTVTQELRLSRAVCAQLNSSQRANLPALSTKLLVYDDASIALAGEPTSSPCNPRGIAPSAIADTFPQAGNAPRL